jgi:hypothetical protein
MLCQAFRIPLTASQAGALVDHGSWQLSRSAVKVAEERRKPPSSYITLLATLRYESTAS